MSHQEWLSKRKNFVKHLRDDEQFLIYDETADTDPEQQQQLSFAPDSERGAALIHKLEDKGTIVVSNMVPASQSNLASHAAHW